jgi:hypothetical protein
MTEPAVACEFVFQRTAYARGIIGQFEDIDRAERTSRRKLLGRCSTTKRLRIQDGWQRFRAGVLTFLA